MARAALVDEIGLIQLALVRIYIVMGLATL